MRASLALLILSTTGCIDFRTERGEVALDYRIDRPRVLAVRLEPPMILPGEPITAHALAWAPGGAEPDEAEVALCGLRDDIRVSVDAVPICFQNPDLVQVVGNTIPATWTAADLSDLDCENWDTGVFVDTDTGFQDPGFFCQSSAPLMVTATWDGVAGRAIVAAPHRLRPLRPGEDLTVATEAAPRSLTVEGDVVAGGEVLLTLRWEEPGRRGRFSWYVDGGDLLSTGITRVQRVETATSEEGAVVETAVITENRLRIPDDWSGPLRVAVVVTGMVPGGEVARGRYWSAGNNAWETLTLEVP